MNLHHHCQQQAKDYAAIRAGLELGLYTFLGFAFQAVGLLTTTASRGAFLLYLNVKIVPFLAFFLFKRDVSANTWISAFLALTGTCLFSTDGSPFNTGECLNITIVAIGSCGGSSRRFISIGYQ